jgi:excisionase family DNA binding protein
MNDATNANPNGDRPNPWLDAEEVAPLLCTTAHTLRRLARQGRCPVVVRRIGGRWRFSRRSVETFVHGTDTQGAS